MRGQDFIIDLCGVIDIFAGVVSLMENGQRVNLPPWKVSVWFPKVRSHTEFVSNALLNLIDGIEEQPDPCYLPRLAESWEELTGDDNGTYKGVQLNEGWLITATTEEVNENGVKEKKYEWTAR